MKFNKDKIMRQNVVIHCTTLQQAKTLLEWADKEGLKWCNGRRYVNDHQYVRYKNQTCYNIKSGSFCGLDYFLGNRRYTILNYKDVVLTNKPKRGGKLL